MIKKKFKREFQPIMYLEKKGERQSVGAFVCHAKKRKKKPIRGFF